MAYKHIEIPADGEQITVNDSGELIVPPNPIIPFLKKKKWYTREKFHEANYENAIKPFKDLAISKETLATMSPSLELSNSMFDELIMPVDCENPKDIKF